MDQDCNTVLSAVYEIATRYQISTLAPLVKSYRAAAAQDEINIAIIGRFKAGKSSFLNHFLGRDFLPIGVIPVTAVITELCYGEKEKIIVHSLDGYAKEVASNSIRQFVAESENPNNVKRVAKVQIISPELARFRGLCFIDTPGLESALLHNTRAALNWFPNVGLALVAVSVDHPLSQQDIILLTDLARYTPRISILLTKADLVNDAERDEVIRFISDLLVRVLGSSINIFAYSVRPNYDDLKSHVEKELVLKTLYEAREQRTAILERKQKTLLQECRDYLRLALASAEMVGAERQTVRDFLEGEKEAIENVKLELRLLTQHAINGTRSCVSSRLRNYAPELEAQLQVRVSAEFPKWRKSLRRSRESFETWLRLTFSEALSAISNKEESHFVEQFDKVKNRVFLVLQNFRDQLSEKTLRAYGVPLRTAETEIQIQKPQTPDIRIGRVFDREWELLSFLMPMRLIRPIVKRHFVGLVPYMVEKNLSRIENQWAESINLALARIGKEAERRLVELIETVERLVVTSPDNAPQIRADIKKLSAARGICMMSRMTTSNKE